MLPLIANEYFVIACWLVALAITLILINKFVNALRTSLRHNHSMVDLINAELPQTQCGQCGHAGCLPYAKAISQGEAINKCPPGGTSTIRRLSILLNEFEDP